MTAEHQELVQDARQYVTGLFANRVDADFVFHNIDHTQEVVEAATLLADHYQLPEQELLILLLAAWFHDTGYSGGQPKRHEELSRDIAGEYLQRKGVDPVIMERVSNCIMATKWPQCPTNLTEQILCDADLFHLGSDNFNEKTKILRQELNRLLDTKLSKKEWRQKNIFFLQQHRYFTDYARTHMEPVKQAHLKALLAKGTKGEEPVTVEKLVKEPLDKALRETGSVSVSPSTEKLSEKEKREREKEKERQSRTDRSIGTMFRIMSHNHVSLSQMADSKANIMISVNTIVMSIMVSVLLGKLQFYPEYIVPTIILLVVCLGAVVFAILATRPNVNRGVFTTEDIQNKQVNLLFFGNFYNMGLKDYDWAMKEMMSDKEYLYSSMIKDTYFLGVVLARKYKYLRISYNIFMFGLVIAILAFAISFLFSEQNVGAN
ncbi:MAG: DUF5706 domain-containing protein [Candidatus Pseudobacter hemicellulosilyticus]|uniref:DUF5706 domain-containing protein n=1 Tax=Candidatus Pseudobacter hemicellulosilyticus TaxID=3121375 RepID=A0AAJ6BGX7_9BACT|nr:MAG: DUF5706 domain-containing protein [Pseudobacter sp.]